MTPKELYATEMEKQFNNWFAKFDSLEALFASRHHLHARLRMEGHLKSEDKAKAFCTAQHFNPFERAL